MHNNLQVNDASPKVISNGWLAVWLGFNSIFNSIQIILHPNFIYNHNLSYKFILLTKSITCCSYVNLHLFQITSDCYLLKVECSSNIKQFCNI